MILLSDYIDQGCELNVQIKMRRQMWVQLPKSV